MVLFLQPVLLLGGNLALSMAAHTPCTSSFSGEAGGESWLAFIPGLSSLCLVAPVLGQDTGPRCLQANVALEDEGWCNSLRGWDLDPMASHGSLGTTTEL